MNALARLAALLTHDDEPVPVEGAGRFAPVPDVVPEQTPASVPDGGGLRAQPSGL